MGPNHSMALVKEQNLNNEDNEESKLIIYSWGQGIYGQLGFFIL